MSPKPSLNKVAITERNPTPPTKPSPNMNRIMQLCNAIVKTPILAWLFGTFIALILGFIALGFKAVFVGLALWILGWVVIVIVWSVTEGS